MCTQNLIQKEFQGQTPSAFQPPHVADQGGPFLPRALLCGCLSSLSSQLSGPSWSFFLCVFSTCTVGCYLQLHSTVEGSAAPLACACVRFLHPEPCVCSQHSSVLFHIVWPSTTWYNVRLHICLHQRKCMCTLPSPHPASISVLCVVTCLSLLLHAADLPCYRFRNAE